MLAEIASTSDTIIICRIAIALRFTFISERASADDIPPNIVLPPAAEYVIAMPLPPVPPIGKLLLSA
jgi:hypothetical protein